MNIFNNPLGYLLQMQSPGTIVTNVPGNMNETYPQATLCKIMLFFSQCQMSLEYTLPQSYGKHRSFHIVWNEAPNILQYTETRDCQILLSIFRKMRPEENLTGFS